ncbi:MAG: hypothetical protein O3C49_01285 [Proteobacteria bacterium]|nr:hypothetical protein [Pseudomonadota bacterium]MDA1325008.1 hypothetical protein [Pseudomonadota bacterium]
MLREEPRNPLLILVLSLYLLLLAFFVVLNTISNVDISRTRAVSGSLNETFAANGRPADKSIKLVSSQGNLLADAAFLSRVGNLIRTELAFAHVEDVLPGRLMVVTMSADSLFIPGREAIDPLHRPIIDRVAKALINPSPGVRYDVDILVGHSNTDDLVLGRSAFLANSFAAAGAPPRSIAAGIEQHSPGQLKFLFHVRPRNEARLIFRDGGEQ